MIQHFTGTLRLQSNSPEPWRYCGTLDLPSGRYCAIRAKVDQDESGKFFQIEGGLEPGMTAAELETVLTKIEADRAKIAQRELDIEDELPF